MRKRIKKLENDVEIIKSNQEMLRKGLNIPKMRYLHITYVRLNKKIKEGLGKLRKSFYNHSHSKYDNEIIKLKVDIQELRLKIEEIQMQMYEEK